MKAGIRTFYSNALKKNVMTKEDFDKAIDPFNIIMTGIEYGIRHYEITCDMNWMLFDSLDKTTVDRFYELKEKFDLTYSVHLPFRSVELAFPDVRISHAYCELICDYIKKLKVLGPEVYVLHPTGGVIQKHVKQSKESYVIRRILEFTKSAIETIINGTGIDAGTIALENLKYPFINLKDIIDQTGVSVCMDAGHIVAQKADSLDIWSFLDEFYDKIIEIHLHDGYNRSTDEGGKSSAHLALGEGDLDYISLLEELKRRKYKGIIILETGFEEALSSYDKIRHLLT